MGGERETLTIRQAAALLGVHPNTVRNRIKAGVYEAEKVVTEHGETYVISRAELEKTPSTNTVPSASHSQPLPDVREAMRGLLDPFVKELGEVREELGRERERREQAERRVAELERQLEPVQEPQDQAQSAESRSGRGDAPGDAPEASAEAQKPTESRSWWRRVFGG